MRHISRTRRVNLEEAAVRRNPMGVALTQPCHRGRWSRWLTGGVGSVTNVEKVNHTAELFFPPSLPCLSRPRRVLNHELVVSVFIAEMGATTLWMFTFAANYSPNSADDWANIKEIMVPIWGSDTYPKKLALRHLFIEAYSRATAKRSRSTSFGSAAPTADFGTWAAPYSLGRADARFWLLRRPRSFKQVAWSRVTLRSSQRRCSKCVGRIASLGVWSWISSRPTRLLGVGRACRHSGFVQHSGGQGVLPLTWQEWWRLQRPTCGERCCQVACAMLRFPSTLKSMWSRRFELQRNCVWLRVASSCRNSVIRDKDGVLLADAGFNLRRTQGWNWWQWVLQTQGRWEADWEPQQNQGVAMSKRKALFAVRSEGLATAFRSEGFVVLRTSEPTGRSRRSSADSFFPVVSGGQSADKFLSIVLELDDLDFASFKPAASS